MKHDVLSPDNITIENNGGYATIKQAREALKQWIKRYETQGYYSSNNGRIALKDLEKKCTFIKLKN
jgi:hypothetical protein